MGNKAHTATLNRICTRYGFTPSDSEDHDIKAEGIIIDVETSSSVGQAVDRLKELEGPVYIAITNNEGLRFVKEKVAGTHIGVMDPRGNVVVPSGTHEIAMGADSP